MKALSLSPPKIETKTRHEVCVCKEFSTGTLTSSRTEQNHILRVDVRRTGRSGTVRLVRTSHSVSCVVVPSNGAESERQTPFFSVRFGSTDRLGWRGPPPSRGCSARRLVRGRDFNLVLEREHRTAPNNEQTRAELMAVSSVVLGRPPLLRRPTTGPCAESPNSLSVIEGRIHGPVYRLCASPCNPGKRSAILVGEAPPAGRKSVCVCVLLSPPLRVARII